MTILRTLFALRIFGKFFVRSLFAQNAGFVRVQVEHWIWGWQLNNRKTNQIMRSFRRGVMGIQRRGSIGFPFLGCEQLGKRAAFFCQSSGGTAAKTCGIPPHPTYRTSTAFSSSLAVRSIRRRVSIAVRLRRNFCLSKPCPIASAGVIR